MRKFTYILILLASVLNCYSQSPHGDLLKVDCAACHDPSGWTTLNENILFDHDNTNFPLDGRHLKTDCKACHTSLIFSESSSECVSCHLDVHEMSVGTDCARCHTSQNWLIDDIPELHEENGFALFGAHATISCADCHISETNLRFDRIGNDCINCHLTNFQNTQNPNHDAAGFSNNCMQCHDPMTKGWEADNLNHDFFPLVQGHDIPNCIECHTTTNYSDASPECASCHIDNYNSTTNPSHTSSNFSTNCKVCHTISTWVPASLDHNSIYPLVGAHASIANDCNQCHNGNFSSTPNTCVGCHLADYNNASNPNHASLQFSTDCTQCHNETAWIPSTFDHDANYFPIYSGKHNNEWNACADCHIIPGNYSIFSCINCHEHNQADMDDKHNGVNNYLYNSLSCFNCHPDGKE